jgi:predicted enzyme related to lactoylglutathione lyase
MAPDSTHPVVHLELHTGNLARACGFYSGLFSWRLEQVRMGSRSYLAVDWGTGIEGGVVEHDTERAMWLPYVEVRDIRRDTRRAEELGASVILAPREGPAGWRSVVAAPSGAEVALWQPKG